MKTKNVLSIIVIVMLGFSLTLAAQDNNSKPVDEIQKNDPDRGGKFEPQGNPDNNRKNHPQNNQDDKGKCSQRDHQPCSFFPDIPNLSKEQAESIKKLQLATEQKSFQLENVLREKEARLKTLTSEDNPDAKAVLKTVDEIGDLNTQILKLKVNNSLEIRKLLTPEQKLDFDRKQDIDHAERPRP